MAGLVVGNEPLLLVGHHLGLALGAGNHPVDGLLELEHPDFLATAPGGEQGRLVDQVGQIGAGEARGAASQHTEIDLLAERLALGVDLEDRLASFHVRGIHHDLPVEASGAEEGRVEDVRPVGGGHDDDTAVALEAVELD